MPTRVRFYAEAVLAGATAVLTAVTALWQDWIEIVTGADPDAGSGGLEWGIVVALAAFTIVLLLVARREYRRAASVPR